MYIPRQKDWVANRYQCMKATEPSEDDIHEAIVSDLIEPLLRRGVQWLHVPNGGARERIPIRRADGSIRWWCPSGKKLKKKGAKPGAPDLMFRWQSRLSPSLQETLDMEIKRPSDGRQSEFQIEWQRQTLAIGGHYCVVRSTKEAFDVLKKFGLLRLAGR